MAQVQRPEEGHTPGFNFVDNFSFLDHYVPDQVVGERLIIDAGYPDVRLSPLKHLSRQLSVLMTGFYARHLMNYTTSFKGDHKLIAALQKHLHHTCSIGAQENQLMITRGRLHAFFVLFQVLLDFGDHVSKGHLVFMWLIRSFAWQAERYWNCQLTRMVWLLINCQLYVEEIK